MPAPEVEKVSILAESYHALARESMELSDLCTVGEPDDEVATAISFINRAMALLASSRAYCLDLVCCPPRTRIPDDVFDRALSAMGDLNDGQGREVEP